MRALDIWTSRVDQRTITEIGQEREGPCISMYRPIAGSMDSSDARAMKELLQEAGDLMRAASIGRRASAAILRPAKSLVDAGQVWRSGSRGIGIFSSPDMFAVVLTSLTLPAQIVVARRFMTRPLLPALEDLTEFEVRSALSALSAPERGPRDWPAVCDPGQVLGAAHSGHVFELYLDRDAHMWGRFDATTSKVARLPSMAPDADDLIDLAAVRTIAHGGRVHVTDRLEIGGERVPILARLLWSRAD